MKRQGLQEICLQNQNIPIPQTPKFISNKFSTQDLPVLLPRNFRKQPLVEQVPSQEISFDFQSQIYEHFRNIQQRNVLNQRLLVQLRKMYDKEKIKSKKLQQQNQLLKQNLEEKERKLSHMEDNIYELYIQREIQQRHSKQNILRLSQKVQEIPELIKGILSQRIMQDSENQKISVERSESSERRTFSLKNFKNSINNLHSLDSFQQF